jgi:hypothetical protein
LLAQARGTGSEASPETSALLSSAQIASTSGATSWRGSQPAAAERNFCLEIAVAHRIDVAAARRRLRLCMGRAVGGGNLDRCRDGGERGIPQHFDLAAQRQHFRITHAGVGELAEPGLAGHQGGCDRVLHAS